MKNLGITLALTAFLTIGLFAQEPAAPEVVKFTAREPAAGDAVNRASDQKMEMQIDLDIPEMGAQSMTQNMNTAETKKCTVLEAKDGNITKFKVEYQKMVGTAEATGPEAQTTDLFADMNPTGQTWTFTQGADGLKIVNEEGEEADSVTHELLSKLELRNEKLGAWFPMFSYLTDKREVSIGETITVDKEKAMSFIPEETREPLGEDAKVVLEMTLRSVTTSLGAEVANFDTKLRISASPNADGMQMTMTMEMDGKMQVGIDNCWVYAAEMKGPITAQGGMPEMGLKMDVSGNIGMKSLSIYSKAAQEQKAEETK